jgi:hypothetical protein
MRKERAAQSDRQAEEIVMQIHKNEIYTFYFVDNVPNQWDRAEHPVLPSESANDRKTHRFR